MACHKLAGADLRADRNFERADLRTSTVVLFGNIVYLFIEFRFKIKIYCIWNKTNRTLCRFRKKEKKENFSI